MAQIFAFREDRLGFRYELTQKAVLGRAPECDLILFDRSASRHHAEIFMVDEAYYIADLDSTNGTQVNERPINIQTRLEPFDSIKIGQELFIFEPGLDVVIGPAPSALIIKELHEEVTGLVIAKVEEAASSLPPEDVPELMALAHRLSGASDLEAIRAGILRYIRNRFAVTFMSVLWPSRPPARRLISLLTSDDDKRLLLSQTPFLRATRDRDVMLWPNSVSELSFREGKRLVGQIDQPSLVGPLYAEGGETGLMYLENLDHKFTADDMKTFAAMLGIISPALIRLANAHNHFDGYAYTPSDASEIILSSSSDQVKIIFSTAAQAAVGNESILLTGEAGTGKAVLAEYIHGTSSRKNGRLVSVNLPTIAPAEIESVLFGRTAESGEDERVGLIELADSGTLFLRHVEYLPPAVQRLLIMVMEEGLFFPLGAPRPKAVDLRIISSTSIDLWDKVEGGFFREDLYSRLNGLNISMPPLREIKSDLDGYLNNFMSKAARDMGLNFTGLDQAAAECLRSYTWPGNTTELKMTAGLLVLFSRSGRVTLEDLPSHLRMAPNTFDDEDGQPPALIAEAERHQLVGAMARTGGDLEAVAAMLSQRPESVILKMRAMGLDPIDYQTAPPLIHPGHPSQTALPHV
ncbi:MAG: sigma 54-interacting transcriptional regulator [Candidatus Adiutrix sp.]|jgi:DNA-binding NtrC family response regulator|nr:sigma 54-interacting transcriptional regulator [Candidatus Adiutrix sp.]